MARHIKEKEGYIYIIYIPTCTYIYTCKRSYTHTHTREIITGTEQEHWLGIASVSFLKNTGVFVHALTACRPRCSSCLLKLFSSHGGEVRCVSARLSPVLCKRLVTRNKVDDLRVTEKVAFGKSVTKCKG